MKKLVRYLVFVPRVLLLFLAVMTVQSGAAALRSTRVFALFMTAVVALSAFGGYQLSHMTYRVNDFSRQHADQVLGVEEELDDAAINLGRQVQEWKDMLLRLNDSELYAMHRKAFIEASIAVQKSLLRAKAALGGLRLNESEVDQLVAEHKALLARYAAAQLKLNPQRAESSRLVDRQVIGMDRELQRHIVRVRADIELLAKQQLSNGVPAQGRPYLLLGLLGTASLLFMALIGFAFASRFHEVGPAARRPSYS